MKVGDAIRVDWCDIRHEDDLRLEQIQELEPAKAITHGKLLKLTDNTLILASTEFPGSGGEPTEYRGILCIPKSVISKIIKLKEVK